MLWSIRYCAVEPMTRGEQNSTTQEIITVQSVSIKSASVGRRVTRPRDTKCIINRAPLIFMHSFQQALCDLHLLSNQACLAQAVRYILPTMSARRPCAQQLCPNSTKVFSCGHVGMTVWQRRVHHILQTLAPNLFPLLFPLPTPPPRMLLKQSKSSHVREANLKYHSLHSHES